MVGRILSELSKTGNVSSWEVSWQFICLIFLLWLSLWLLPSVCHSIVLSRWPLKERWGVKVKKCISPRHCLQKWHQTTNVENVLIFPGLLSTCVIVHLLQKAVVLKMEMLFGQKKRKKMLMFCSLALLVKIKLCGGNLCESGFFSFIVVCRSSCSTDLTAQLLPYLIVLRMKYTQERGQDCFFVTFTFS